MFPTRKPEERCYDVRLCSSTAQLQLQLHSHRLCQSTTKAAKVIETPRILVQPYPVSSLFFPRLVSTTVATSTQNTSRPYSPPWATLTCRRKQRGNYTTVYGATMARERGLNGPRVVDRRCSRRKKSTAEAGGTISASYSTRTRVDR